MKSNVTIAAGRDDAIGLALVTLVHEVWVMRDRQMVTEAMLRERGLLGDIEAYQPGPELAERIAGERDRFVGAITTMLLTGKPAEI